MPIVQDYEADDDEKSPGGSSGARLGGSSSGSVMAEPSKQDEPDFVPWERFVSANKDVSQREAGKLASGVESRASDVTARRDAAGLNQKDAVQSNYNTPAPPPGNGAFATGPKQGSFAQAGSSFGRSREQPASSPAAAASAPQPNAATSLAGTAQPPRAAARPQERPAESWAAAVEPRPQSAPAPSINADKLKTDVEGGAPKTSGYNLAGWKDLEAQLGSAGWNKLVGDTVHAQGDADALGSESGVEALLRQHAPGPSSAFDAALISGAGGKRFGDLSKQYGGGTLTEGLAGANAGAQSDWAKLMGDVDAAAAARDAEIRSATENMDRLANGQKAGPQQSPSAPGGSGNTLGGFGSYNDFREKLAVGGGVHGVGEDLSLADQLINKLGEGGFYEGKNVAGTFRDSTLGSNLDSVAGSLDDQNRYQAFQNVESMYGSWAAEWVWNNLTEDVWNAMGGKNAGAIYRMLAELIEKGLANGTLTKNSAGQITPVLTEQQQKEKAEKEAAFTKSTDIRNQRTSGESVTGPDGKSREMTPAQNYARAAAYQNGWGEEWDRQFLAGADEPVSSSASAGGSGQFIYDEDGNVIGLT